MRKHLIGDGPIVLDQTWRAGWAESAEEYFRLIEAMVFTEKYDAPLKTALKQRKSCAETLQLEGLAEIVEDIEETLTEEKHEVDEIIQNALESAGEEDNDDDDDVLLQLDGDTPTVTTSQADPKKETAEALGQLAIDITAEKVSLPVNDEVVKDAAASALRLIRTHVTWVNEDALSEEELASKIKESFSGGYDCRTRPATLTHCSGAIFDSKLIGEGNSDPHVRMPPTPPTRVRRLVTAALKARHLVCKDIGRRNKTTLELPSGWRGLKAGGWVAVWTQGG